MSSEVQEKYKQAKKMLHRANILLEDLEMGRNESEELQEEISMMINRLARQLDVLKSLVDTDTSVRRELLKRQVKALQEEHSDVQTGLEKYLKGAHKRRMAATNRKDLYSRMVADEDLTATEALSRESDSIAKSRQRVSGLVAEGSAVLEALKSQSNTFRSTQSKLLSFMESLNISGSIITTINRTQRADRMIVYSGMVAITFLMFLIYWFR
ncbi:Protein transport protein bos1 [Diplonema papillatum]|nr:Protein transport protein bos1 [Diplonema papillatum]|eukprot:gene16454-25217_t